MRSGDLLLPAIVLAAAALPAPALAASSGGATAPPASTGGAAAGAGRAPARSTPRTAPVSRRAGAPAGAQVGGGARVGRGARQRLLARRRAPVLLSFAVGGSSVLALGAPAPVNFRIRAGTRFVYVWLTFSRPGTSGTLTKIALGARRAGTAQAYAIATAAAGALAPGRYVVSISARDTLGRRLPRTASAQRSLELASLDHRFPLVGAFSYGGSASRFGAARSGHRHQGQDLSAAAGTPVVAPRSGTVEFVRYQAAGAGHYVVLDGDDEDRDYVFMHLRTGSVLVREGQHVSIGQQLAQVGSTGASSGPHLHFEVWVGGWYAAGGYPIDPLPLLRSWQTASPPAAAPGS